MNYSDFYNDVLLDCPRATTPIALNAIRNTVIEFCQKSRIWQQVLGAVDAVLGTSDYTPAIPSRTELVEVMSAYLSGNEITFKTQDQLDAMFGNWRGANVTGDPLYYTIQTPGQITVVPQPSRTISAALQWRVAMRPSRDSTDFDPSNTFASEFYEGIASGAKARLMFTPNMPYSNLKLGEYHKMEFAKELNRARLRTSRSFGRANLLTQDLPRSP